MYHDPFEEMILLSNIISKNAFQNKKTPA